MNDIKVSLPPEPAVGSVVCMKGENRPHSWPCPTVGIVVDALRKMGAIE